MPPVRPAPPPPRIATTLGPVQQRERAPIPGLVVLNSVISMVLGSICSLMGGFATYYYFVLFRAFEAGMKSDPAAREAVGYRANPTLCVTIFTVPITALDAALPLCVSISTCPDIFETVTAPL